MSNEKTSEQSLFDAAKALVEKLIAIEQDPDLVSVFSIARAHGYKITSRFWHEESSALAKALVEFQKSKAEEAAEAEAKKSGKNPVLAEVVDLPPQPPPPPAVPSGHQALTSRKARKDPPEDN